MNYIFDEDTGINRENYETLSTAIIMQAIIDLENGLTLNKTLKGRKPRNKREKTIRYIADDAERFFLSQYFVELSRSDDMDGRAILKECKDNFRKYGKCVLSTDDWDKIKRGELLKPNKGRQTVYMGGVK